jgi:hypothetical protein
VQLEVRLPLVVQREYAFAADVEVAAHDLQHANVARRILVVAVDVRFRDFESADTRWLKRRLHGRLDAVDRHSLGHVGDRRIDVDRAADTALQLRIRAEIGGIEALDRRVDLHVRGVVRHLRVEGELRHVTAHDGGVGQRSVCRHVHRFRRRSAAARGNVAVDRALIAIDGQRRHIELLADLLQIELRDRRVRGIGDCLAVQHGCARRRSAGDLRAGERGRLELQVRLHVLRRVRAGRHRSGDVVVRVDVGHRLRRAHGLRQLLEIEFARLAAQVERNRLRLRILQRPVGNIGKDDVAGRARAGAVRVRVRGQRDAAALDLGLGVERAGDVSRCRDVRGAQVDAAAQRIDVRERVAVHVHLRARRDVALLLRIAEDRREIQTADGHIALHRLRRLQDVGDEVPGQLTCSRTDVHLDSEPIERSAQLHLEGGLQRDARQRRNERCDFGNRQLVGGHPQVQVRLREVVLYGAVDRDRALRRMQLQLLHVHGVVVDRDAAGQRVERQTRIGAAEGDVRDFNRVPHGLVLEVELRVEVLELLRHGHAARSDRALDFDCAVADADVRDRDRSYGSAAVGFGCLLFDEAAQLPAVAVAAQIDHRVVEPDVVD